MRARGAHERRRYLLVGGVGGGDGWEGDGRSCTARQEGSNIVTTGCLLLADQSKASDCRVKSDPGTLREEIYTE